MTIEYWNPKWYFWDSFSDEQINQSKEIIDPLLDDESFWGNQPEWSKYCMMTASTTQKGDDNHLVSKWLDVLRPTFQKFLDEMSWKCEVDIKPDGLWINKYNKHEHQEFHNHSMSSCNLSMVYFHRCEGDDFHFFDTEWQFNRANGLHDVVDLPNFEVLTPEDTQHKVIIFPSQYGHFVSPNKSDSRRVTVSGNFKVMKREYTMRDIL